MSEKAAKRRTFVKPVVHSVVPGTMLGVLFWSIAQQML